MTPGIGTDASDIVSPTERYYMIVVVGSREGEFKFMGPGKVPYYHEDDPNNRYYDEMCGHRWLYEHVGDIFSAATGLEHYRRAFKYAPREREEILKDYDIIVKNEHGPFGCTNLQVMAGCSRYHVNYLKQATAWVKRWPELEEQANYDKHWGCNMMITNPLKYEAMMHAEFQYIDEMLKYPDLQPSVIGYFCETILTPYIIRKFNSRIFVGEVVQC